MREATTVYVPAAIEAIRYVPLSPVVAVTTTDPPLMACTRAPAITFEPAGSVILPVMLPDPWAAALPAMPKHAAIAQKRPTSRPTIRIPLGTGCVRPGDVALPSFAHRLPARNLATVEKTNFGPGSGSGKTRCPAVTPLPPCRSASWHTCQTSFACRAGCGGSSKACSTSRGTRC